MATGSVHSRTHYKLLIEGEFLGQWDLSDRKGGFREVTVTIESAVPYVPKQVRFKKVRMPDGTTVRVKELNKRIRIAFVGKRKAWLAGPVSQSVISDLHGPYIEDWGGKQITICVDQNVMMGRKRTGGIRVKNVRPSGPSTTDPLDEEVDEVAAANIAEAFGDDDGGEVVPGGRADGPPVPGGTQRQPGED